MHYFEYRGGELYCEEVPLRQIAADVGTPAYIYSEQTLHRHVRVFDQAFESAPHLICYAVKANSNINLLRRFTQEPLKDSPVAPLAVLRLATLLRTQDNGAREAAGLLAENPNPTEQEVRHALEGNLCRCTGYHNIVKAVLDAAKVKGPSVSEQQEVTA